MKNGIYYKDAHGDYWHVFKDINTNDYCFYSHSQQSIKSRSRNQLTTVHDINEVSESTYPRMTAKLLSERVESLHIVNTPHKPQGAKGKYFNTFRMSEGLKVMRTGQLVGKPLQAPQATMDFYSYLFQDVVSRDYFLDFFRIKLSTFKPSNVIFNFSCIQGGGKGLLIKHLNAILTVSKPSYGSFKSDFNSWLENAYLVNLNEYGKRMHTHTQKEDFYEKLKEFSEQGDILINVKNKKEQPIHNLATFIITTNTDPIIIENDDRRMVYADLTRENIEDSWVAKKYGGADKLMAQMLKEVPDFCYALLNQKLSLTPITDKEYRKPPVNALKKARIREDTTTLQKIVNAFENKTYNRLIEIADEKGVRDFTKGWSDNKLLRGKLVEILDKGTTPNALTKALKHLKLNYKSLRHEGGVHWGYVVPKLHESLLNKPNLSVVSNSLMDLSVEEAGERLYLIEQEREKARNSKKPYYNNGIGE